MEYKIVERDFVSRSLLVLQQYEEHVKPSTLNKEHFEVTLLLNCLLGLVVLPFEHLKREQKNIFPKMCEEDETPIYELESKWGLDDLRIEKIVVKGTDLDKKEITLRIIVAMFRHSMTHAQFGDGNKTEKPNGLSVVYQTNKSNSSKSDIFEVNIVNKHYNTEFIANIPVKSLRKFAEKLASTFLKENFSSINDLGGSYDSST